METNETEPICEGCKSRDAMIKRLAERVDELEYEREQLSQANKMNNSDFRSHIDM